MAYGQVYDGSGWNYNFVNIFNSGSLHELTVENRASVKLAGVQAYDKQLYALYSVGRVIYLYVCGMELESGVLYTFNAANSTTIYNLNFSVTSSTDIKIAWNQQIGGIVSRFNVFHADLVYASGTWGITGETQITVYNSSNDYYLSDLSVDLVTGISYLAYRLNATLYLAYGQVASWTVQSITTTGPYYVKLVVDSGNSVINYVGTTLAGSVYTSKSSLTGASFTEIARAISFYAGSFAIAKHERKIFIAGYNSSYNIIFARVNDDNSNYIIKSLKASDNVTKSYFNMSLSKKLKKLFFSFTQAAGGYQQVHIGYCDFSGNGYTKSLITRGTANHALPAEATDGILFDDDNIRAYWQYYISNDVRLAWESFEWKSQLKYFDGSNWV